MYIDCYKGDGMYFKDEEFGNNAKYPLENAIKMIRKDIERTLVAFEPAYYKDILIENVD
jgi:hypothetical protein